jgi:hypothetical protein
VHAYQTDRKRRDRSCSWLCTEAAVIFTIGGGGDEGSQIIHTPVTGESLRPRVASRWRK